MQLDHVGVAVRSLTEAVPRFEQLLGVKASPVEAVESQRVRVTFLDVGASHVELLEGTEPESPVGRFVERRGEGMHHVAFRVPSVDERLADLERAGARLVDRVGRPGARGMRVGFVHPSAFQGVLVEFVEGA